MNELTSTLQDMSTGMLFALGFLVIVEFGLLIAALVSIFRRPADRINGPKVLWVIVSLFGIVGPILYFALGRAPEKVELAPEDVASPVGRGESVADVLYGERSGDGGHDA